MSGQSETYDDEVRRVQREHAEALIRDWLDKAPERDTDELGNVIPFPDRRAG